MIRQQTYRNIAYIGRLGKGYKQDTFTCVYVSQKSTNQSVGLNMNNDDNLIRKHVPEWNTEWRPLGRALGRWLLVVRAYLFPSDVGFGRYYL
jgi:hypothetical protein